MVIATTLLTTDTQVGWCVDDNDDAYIGESILFYPIYQLTSMVLTLDF